ncbi:hypothetical protein [Microbacterium sp.]|uniref:hypothetical protein n=1 Tax=Microbacterium sp. TaxID=51671 RepID=UPI0037354A52
MAERKAVTRQLAASYRAGDKARKTRILDEVVELTGWHRDWARAVLRDAGSPVRPAKARAPRAPTYGPELMPALITCWATLRAPAGRLLAPMLPVLVPLLRRDGDVTLTDEQAALLSRISAATIDRRLALERAKMLPRGRSHTKPGSLLKSQIPIRTWADWDDAVPGCVEIDLVGHDGGNPSGQFCFTLTVTDIATGWTVNRSVQNKALKWVFDALQQTTATFRSRSSGSTPTTAPSSSTSTCSSTAASSTSRSLGPGLRTRTTARTWSRRTGRGGGNWSAISATTRSASWSC